MSRNNNSLNYNQTFLIILILISIITYVMLCYSTIPKKEYLQLPTLVWGLIFLFFTILVYAEYAEFTRNLNVDVNKKILYTLVDAFHILLGFIKFALIYLILTRKNKVNYLLLLNIFYLFVIFLFFVYKRCIVSVLSNQIINKNISFKNTTTRLEYLLFSKTKYRNESNDYDNMMGWIKSNKTNVFIVILVNTYVFLTHNNII